MRPALRAAATERDGRGAQAAPIRVRDEGSRARRPGEDAGGKGGSAKLDSKAVKNFDKATKDA